MGRDARIKKIVNRPTDFATVPRQVLEQSKQIPRHTLVADMASFLAKMPLDDKEREILYRAILNRYPTKTCVRCGILFALGIEGNTVELKGDSTPVCRGCEAVLKEKGQIS
jgi:hypothetical protein